MISKSKEETVDAVEETPVTTPEAVEASNTDALNRQRHDAHEARDDVADNKYATDSSGAFIN